MKPQVSVVEVDLALRAALQRTREGNWEVAELRRQVDRRPGSRHAAFVADLTGARGRVSAESLPVPSTSWPSF